MIVIAFDLSLSNTGYAVGEVTDGRLKLLEVGSIGTKRFAQRSTGFRLHYIANEIKALYKKYEIDKVVKERSFSNGNITATQQIFKVNGVFELMSHLGKHDDFVEITPPSVKKQLTGNGKASKEEVANAVLKHFRDIMGNPTITFSNKDESDAVAVLIAYCKQEGLIK
ncbi:crossover junction endodeoxyribonuclease RuvC [Neobacillus vireti]|uniref:crossover junction endodeoxyribonuclease RuvC n=1 Tax=Neobacillus vireti TaxID=220686 RepID=UPI002FFEB9DC